jgi:dTDP-D-glucose 4,6-dehydratase
LGAVYNSSKYFLLSSLANLGFDNVCAITLKDDLQKAKELMDWSPQVSLDKGLRLTIEWVKNHLELFKPDQYTV